MRRIFPGSLTFAALVATLTSSAFASPADPVAGSVSDPSAPRLTRSPGDQAAPAPPSEDIPKRDVRREIPITAYTYSATGAPAKSLGVQAYGLGLAASRQDPVIGGGGTVWWGPIERLTLVLDGARNAWGEFSPSVAGMYRLVGKVERGGSMAGLGKFKVDGFSGGPDGDEVESEAELGALVGFSEGGWHLDANAIWGVGLGDEGEMDVESRLRFGRDLGEILRLGLDAQARFRLEGEEVLANGRTWDFAAGAQAVLGSQSFFGSLTAGPATMGLTSKSLGVLAILAIGGTT